MYKLGDENFISQGEREKINGRLIEEYKNGKRQIDLVRKYNISKQRVSQLVKRFKIRGY